MEIKYIALSQNEFGGNIKISSDNFETIVPWEYNKSLFWYLEKIPDIQICKVIREVSISIFGPNNDIDDFSINLESYGVKYMYSIGELKLFISNSNNKTNGDHYLINLETSVTIDNITCNVWANINIFTIKNTKKFNYSGFKVGHFGIGPNHGDVIINCDSIKKLAFYGDKGIGNINTLELNRTKISEIGIYNTSLKINELKILGTSIIGGLISGLVISRFIVHKSTIQNTGFYNVKFPDKQGDFIVYQSLLSNNTYSGVNWGNYLGEETKYQDGYFNEEKNINIGNKEMQENYRMLKHEHDEIGNKTEANKFFAKEMEYYERSLSLWEWDKKIISFIQRYSNNYGNSWLRPFIWIIIVSFLYTYLSDCWDFKCTCGGVQNWHCFQSHWLKNVSQFPTELKNAKDWWFLLYAIIMGSLFYQLLVALRRISQR